MDRFVGEWLRVRRATDDPYPDRLVFHPDGTYQGEMVKPAAFTLWDVGTYEVVTDSEVAISTANDAVVQYGYTLDRDLLTIAQPDNAQQWTYRRTPADRRQTGS